MWFAVKKPSSQHVKEYPYEGLNPVNNELIVIENKEQVYEILMQCYDEANRKGYDIGEALYEQHFMFADSVMFLNQEHQNLIKKYIFCDNFKCPPYPSLQETPADLIDNFLLIKREIQKASIEGN